MAWFRVDDQLHGHPKARQAGLAAMGLWSLAGSYSASYGLAGDVPAHYVAGWPNGRKLAQALVACGLWETTENGWRFHDWDDYQPSADEIEEARAAARRRQREHRQKLRSQRDNQETK